MSLDRPGKYVATRGLCEEPIIVNILTHKQECFRVNATQPH